MPVDARVGIRIVITLLLLALALVVGSGRVNARIASPTARYVLIAALLAGAAANAYFAYREAFG